MVIAGFGESVQYVLPCWSHRSSGMWNLLLHGLRTLDDGECHSRSDVGVAEMLPTMHRAEARTSQGWLCLAV